MAGTMLRPVALIAAVLLTACAAPVPPKPPIDKTPKAPSTLVQTRASFDCTGALPAVHRQICTDDQLARLDKELVARQHQLQQELDPVGSLLLAANHRRWLLSRAEQCDLVDGEPSAQGRACLVSLYQQRLQALQTWAQPAPVAPGGVHAMASYAEFRLAM